MTLSHRMFPVFILGELLSHVHFAISVLQYLHSDQVIQRLYLRSPGPFIAECVRFVAY